LVFQHVKHRDPGPCNLWTASAVDNGGPIHDAVSRAPTTLSSSQITVFYPALAPADKFAEAG
jgi:hypothetical protein